MPGKQLAIIGAMHRELAPMLRGIQPRKADGVRFFELDTAVITIGGIGRKAAQWAAEVTVAKYGPGLMISAGIAGAVSRELKVGDVVSASIVVDVEAGTRYPAIGGEAVIATSSLSSVADKRMLAERWKADVVDMESAAVASVAEAARVEFMAIKCISDEADFVMPPLARFVDEDGRFKTLRFAAYMSLRPTWWNSVRQLSANSSIAAANLCEALKHLIKQRLVLKSAGMNLGSRVL
jgi:adenosylhomocysteine nucleosidase